MAAEAGIGVMRLPLEKLWANDEAYFFVRSDKTKKPDILCARVQALTNRRLSKVKAVFIADERPRVFEDLIAVKRGLLTLQEIRKEFLSRKNSVSQQFGLPKSRTLDEVQDLRLSLHANQRSLDEVDKAIVDSESRVKELELKIKQIDFLLRCSFDLLSIMTCFYQNKNNEIVPIPDLQKWIKFPKIKFDNLKPPEPTTVQFGVLAFVHAKNKELGRIEQIRASFQEQFIDYHKQDQVETEV